MKYKQVGNELNFTIPTVNSKYLDAIMGKKCFMDLFPLFSYAHSPAKEFTESYSALHHIRKHVPRDKEYTVIHVGDGGHARTGALFSFMTNNTENYSIDPIMSLGKISKWMEDFNVKRLGVGKLSIEKFSESLKEWNIEHHKIILTFVHAHVDTQKILNIVPKWDYAFVLSCCEKKRQLVDGHVDENIILDQGEDWGVMSPHRTYQMIKRK